jgi:hypothetical protein
MRLSGFDSIPFVLFEFCWSFLTFLLILNFLIVSKTKKQSFFEFRSHNELTSHNFILPPFHHCRFGGQQILAWLYYRW